MYQILIYTHSLSPLGEHVAQFFEADICQNPTELRDMLAAKNYRALIVDGVLAQTGHSVDLCEEVFMHADSNLPPIIVLTKSYNLQDKIKAFEIGCDDYLDTSVDKEEVCARVTKSIFHSIANEQLNKRLESATETAHTAMADNSDLGASIQFLLAVHDCDNLDQLGQQFFKTIERYGLRCSLQMRTEMGIKDMEAHGMAKDLESQLLYQLKDTNRYVDFGRRTIINFDRVSLLIKNMPLDDPDKYGAIKDNTFCLVQGVNARVLALEEHEKLIREQGSLKKLSSDVKDVIGSLKESYQDVMRQIAGGVEVATEIIENRLPHLALTEEDEKFIEDVLENLTGDTTEIFNDGLKVDEIFERLEESVKRTLRSVEQPANNAELGGSKSDKGSTDGGEVVELF